MAAKPSALTAHREPVRVGGAPTGTQHRCRARA